MPTLLKETKPVARKEHECMFCGEKIKIGQKYLRQTAVLDDAPYDFICHEECQDVAKKLGMYDDCDPDYGLQPDEFVEFIDQYVYDNHYDNEKDDISEEWQKLSLYEKIVRIDNENK